MQDHTRSVLKYYLFFPETKKKNVCAENIRVRRRKMDDLKSEEGQERRDEKKRKVEVC